MVEGMFKKGLVVGIILLFITIAIPPITQSTLAVESNELEVLSPDPNPWAWFEKPAPQGLFIFDIIDAEFPFCLIIGKITIKINAGCDGGELDKVELIFDDEVITFYEPPYEYLWGRGKYTLNYIEVIAYASNVKVSTGFPVIKIL